MYGYIYKTTNMVNGKIYVGQHIADTFTEKYKGSGLKLKASIKKYGNNNFKVELLQECLSLQELNDSEMLWIKELNSTDDRIGYNIKLGGNNAPWSEEVKQRMSKSATGKKRSAEARLSNSKAKMGNHYAGTCNLGKVVVNDGSRNKFILPSEVETYVSMGYTVGVKPSTPEKMQRYKEKYLNRVYIHKDNANRYVHNDEVNLYLADGWLLGRVGYTASRGNKISSTKRCRIKVVRGEEIRYIRKEDLLEYEEMGFSRPVQNKKETLG